MINRFFSNGNKKIGKDTLIFNMTPALKCPSDKLGLCHNSQICYAKQAERMYPQVLPYRIRQMKWWKSVDPLRFSAHILSLKLRKRNIIKFIRLNESGDFTNQDDVEKISDSAKYLCRYGLIFYTYTARKDLVFHNYEKNLIINGSGFMLDNEYNVIGHKSMPKRGQRLCAMDCRGCMLCKESKHRIIVVRRHGCGLKEIGKSLLVGE